MKPEFFLSLAVTAASGHSLSLAALREQQARLQEQEALRRRQIRKVIHDLRTCLHTMQLTEELAQIEKLPHECQEYLQGLSETKERLRKITEELALLLDHPPGGA